MAALPYMQLYVADYLADTAHLTTEEHGAYLLLLFSYWQTGKALRADRLAAVSRLSNERWQDVEPTLKEFFHVDDGVWMHFRVEADLEKVDSKSKKNSNAGKASAKAKALLKQSLKENPVTNVVTNVTTNVEQTNQRNGNHTRSGDTDTDTDTEDQKRLAKKLAADAEKKKSDEAFSIFWKLYPKKVSKADAVKAWSKTSPDMHDQIIQALGTHCTCDQWVKDDGKFIPNASTWLNKQKWEDEVKPHVAGKSNTRAASTSRPSLSEQVRQQNAALEAERRREAGQGPESPDELPGAGLGEAGCFDGEFERIDESNGKIVGTDDRLVRPQVDQRSRPVGCERGMGQGVIRH